MFSLRLLAFGALLAGAASLPLAASAATYSEDFNDGTAEGWSLDGLWHLTDNSPNGTTALGYVKDETAGTTLNGNYDTQGYPNSGTATTPELTCGSICELSFDWLDDTEGGLFYDLFWVYIDSDGGSDLILQENLAYTTYQSFTADLISLLGLATGDTFTVRFTFDTIDGVANWAPGVRVDNFAFSSAVTPVPLPSTGLMLLAGLAGLAGNAFRVRARR